MNFSIKCPKCHEEFEFDTDVVDAEAYIDGNAYESWPEIDEIWMKCPFCNHTETILK